MTPPVKKENYELLLYRLDQIERKIDAMSKNYVTNDVFDSKIDELELKIRQMQQARNLANWVNPIIASISTALVTFLLIEFLRKK
jgi:predicted metalloenzyme YecM